jgi:hypothetical protein
LTGLLGLRSGRLLLDGSGLALLLLALTALVLTWRGAFIVVVVAMLPLLSVLSLCAILGALRAICLDADDRACIGPQGGYIALKRVCAKRRGRHQKAERAAGQYPGVAFH